MIQFQKITSVSDPLFVGMFNLYCNAFPANERRSWDGLEFELTYQKLFFANAIMQQGKFVGLLNFWNFETFWYIEHLAVVPIERGHHIGTEIMEIFKSKIKDPILLEVELPTIDQAKRRIGFYEKLGFSILPHNYIQPPYEVGGIPVPMLLMSNEPTFASDHFERVKELLYEKVYHAVTVN
jgi:ribosomal protein S18 acetylase RimI-like enzyme